MIREKCLPLQSQLGYGVMVTLQILVLPFLVRVRVAQHNEENLATLRGSLLFITPVCCYSAFLSWFC